MTFVKINPLFLGIVQCLSSTTFLTVDVEDINDGPPSFSSLFYTLHVWEDTSVNPQFEVVMATDGNERSKAELTFIADSMGEDV